MIWSLVLSVLIIALAALSVFTLLAASRAASQAEESAAYAAECAREAADHLQLAMEYAKQVADIRLQASMPPVTAATIDGSGDWAPISR